MRDITLEDTIYLEFSTRAFATGIPTTLAGSPVVSWSENGGANSATGVTLGVDLNSVAGNHLLTIVATAANGFENGKDYNLKITTGTVGGVSVVGEKVESFSIGRSAAAVDLANGTDGLTALKTAIDGAPTTAEFEARTLVAASYFDPSADTVANVTTVAGVTGGATSAAQTTAQNDLDTITGADGVTLATAQGLYAPAKAGDNMGTVSSVIGNVDGSTASVTGAVGSVTGNVGGNVTGSVGSNIELGPAEVNAEVVDALATDTYAEPGQGAPAATTSLVAKINYLYKAWRNKVEQTATTASLYDDAGTTVDQKATVSDDGTTFTKGEQGTGP